MSASDVPEELNDASVVDPKHPPSSGSTVRNAAGGGSLKQSLASKKATPPPPLARGASADKTPSFMDVDDEAEVEGFVPLPHQTASTSGQLPKVSSINAEKV